MRVQHFDQSPAVTHHYARNDPLFVPSCPVLGGGGGGSEKTKWRTNHGLPYPIFLSNAELLKNTALICSVSGWLKKPEGTGGLLP